MATDTVGGRARMQTREVIRSLLQRVTGYIRLATLLARTVLFRWLLIGSNQDTQSWAAGSYGRLERMAKGLHWAGVDDNNATNKTVTRLFCPRANDCLRAGPWAAQWQAAINNDNTQNTSFDSDYEVIGPGVFRFEYFYLLKNGRVTDWPWDRWSR